MLCKTVHFYSLQQYQAHVREWWSVIDSEQMIAERERWEDTQEVKTY